MGLCRQLKDEIVRCPPILVLTGRADDAWLATWSRADGVVPHPVDPIRLPAVVASLLRPRVGLKFVRPGTRHQPRVNGVTTWPEVLSSLMRRTDQTAETAGWVMQQILSGSATPAQVAAFVVALRSKGETVTELTGLVEVMLEFATPIAIPGPAVDVVGSGGDRMNTVNISTMAAVVAAAAGAVVVKHGNRAASSACGAADVLEELGIVLDLAPQAQQQVVQQVGIGFLFAPQYHPALRHVGPTRRELGIPTTFNFLGPLANPAQPTAQAVGVSDPRMAELMAGVFAARGNQGLVVHGLDGLDELTTTTSSTVWVYADGVVRQIELDPQDLGIPRATLAELVGGDPRINASSGAGHCRTAARGRSATSCCSTPPPPWSRTPSRPADGLLDAFAEHLARAREAVDSGAARAKLAPGSRRPEAAVSAQRIVSVFSDSGACRATWGSASFGTAAAAMITEPSSRRTRSAVSRS